jgi:hypothetical membrane protein
VFLVEGTRTGYDPVSMTVSQLATGADGWTQTLSFVATGALVVAFALGTRRAIGGVARGSVAGPAVLALFGLGIIGAGLFATDPGGYPPGVPAPAVESLHSTMHDLVSLVVFLSLPVACLVFAAGFAALGDRRWAIGSAVVGLVLGGVLVALLAGHFGTVEVGRSRASSSAAGSRSAGVGSPPWASASCAAGRRTRRRSRRRAERRRCGRGDV